MANRAVFGIKVNENDTMYVLQEWAPERLFKQYATVLRNAMPYIIACDPAKTAAYLVNSIEPNKITVNEFPYGDHHAVIFDTNTNTVHLVDRFDPSKVVVSWSLIKFVRKYR
jgi:DNA-binding beta-propeller fold protein YncE